jgi:predicted AAA+ superfamily ATPase
MVVDMLQDLIQLHHELMGSLNLRHRRFLYDRIHWESQSICIYGARGVGKTTMLCQNLIETYESVDRALYISADNIHVLSKGLLRIAAEYFSMGGEALYIDEVHKYPNWSIEVKNIIDSFRKKRIIISGSSAMDLHDGKADLSRRVVYYELPGLSFREYLAFIDVKEVHVSPWEEIIGNHVQLSSSVADIPILKHFKDYLLNGYYPFFLESREVYLSKLHNVIEKVITEDIALSKKIKPGTVVLLKKLLWFIATAKCLSPNIDSISKDLKVTREVVYSGFDYLSQAGLIQNIYPNSTGMRLVRKPGKTYLNNTNLLHAINGALSLESDAGSARETFFANQVGVMHALHTHEKADFTVDNKYVVEVGGRNKQAKQVRGVDHAIMALDNIPAGFGNRIPLYLFGFLY